MMITWTRFIFMYTLFLVNLNNNKVSIQIFCNFKININQNKISGQLI